MSRPLFQIGLKGSTQSVRWIDVKKIKLTFRAVLNISKLGPKCDVTA